LNPASSQASSMLNIIVDVAQQRRVSSLTSATGIAAVCTDCGGVLAPVSALAAILFRMRTYLNAAQDFNRAVVNDRMARTISSSVLKWAYAHFQEDSVAPVVTVPVVAKALSALSTIDASINQSAMLLRGLSSSDDVAAQRLFARLQSTVASVLPLTQANALPLSVNQCQVEALQRASLDFADASRALTFQANALHAIPAGVLGSLGVLSVQGTATAGADTVLGASTAWQRSPIGKLLDWPLACDECSINLSAPAGCLASLSLAGASAVAASNVTSWFADFAHGPSAYTVDFTKVDTAHAELHFTLDWSRVTLQQLANLGFVQLDTQPLPGPAIVRDLFEPDTLFIVTAVELTNAAVRAKAWLNSRVFDSLSNAGVAVAASVRALLQDSAAELQGRTLARVTAASALHLLDDAASDADTSAGVQLLNVAASVSSFVPL